MKLVVDTNILFSFFKANSVTRKIMVESSIDLYAPQKTFFELKKHKHLICKKSGIDLDSFNNIIDKLKLFIKIIPNSKFQKFYREAIFLLPDKAKDDAPFVGLAFYLDIPLCSNDSLLKKQDKVIVFSTSEIIKIFKLKK